MTQKIKRVGMQLTGDGHVERHAGHGEMTPEEHGKFLRKMGISRREDKEWHETQSNPARISDTANKSVNPFAIGGAFLAYCVRQGWLIQRGKGRTIRYFATDEGRTRLKKFDIDI